MIAIVIPWPDKKLSPNARIHWAQKMKISKAAKDLGKLHGSQCLPFGPLSGNLSLELAFHPKTRRRYDVDNVLASLKNFIDGLCAALNIDDSQITKITLIKAPVDPNKKGFIELALKC